MNCGNVIALSHSTGEQAFAVNFLAFGEYFLTSSTIVSNMRPTLSSSDPIVSNFAWNFLAQTQSRQTGIRACQLGRDHVKLRLELPCSDAITSDFVWSFPAQTRSRQTFSETSLLREKS